MTLPDLYLQQQQIEMESIENGILRYRKARMDSDISAQTPEMRYIAKGMETLVPAIEELQRRVAVGDGMAGMFSWGLPIISVPAQKLALLTLNTIFTCHKTSRTYMAFQVAGNVLLQVVYEKAKFHEPGLVSRLEHKMKGGYSSKVKGRLRSSIPDHVNKTWSQHVRLHVGAILVNTALECTDVVSTCKVITSTGRKAIGIQVASEMRDSIENQHSNLELMRPMCLPMIVPPKDWTTLWDGGYLIGDDEYSCISPLVKEGFKNHLELVTPETMGIHLECVNHLQGTKWAVNTFISKIVQHICDTDSEIGSILNTSPLLLIDKSKVNWDSAEESLQYNLEARAVHDHNHKTTGQRSLFMYLRSVAKDYAKYVGFYFQWQVDFRARDYPRFCGMDPQGDKLHKSYLQFATGHPLTKSGYKWLTVHLANCMGYDKESIEDRISKVHERAEEIHQWAADPLSHTGWAEEDKTMTLAAAKEWSEATMSGTPETYISYIPIGIDGKCNGLQHLSALARDSVGAYATCLIPDDVPQDIYTLVLDKVNERVDQTIREATLDQVPFVLPPKLTSENVEKLSDDDKVTRKRQQNAVSAKYWRGKTSRNLVKRGAMTWGYGVTEQGIMTQLITDGFLNDENGKMVENAPVYASYMRDCIYWAVNNTVLSARDVMEWLQYVSGVASELGEALWWTNPGGMRIHQEYLKPTRRKVETIKGRFYFYIKDLKKRKLAVRKQKNGIAPNFVHSIDAAHMAKVVLRLKEYGITDMHMIHDSFGVHACYVELLHEIVREEFVKIHEVNWLQKFKYEVEEQLGVELEPYPQQGDYDVREIRRSEYAFS